MSSKSKQSKQKDKISFYNAFKSSRSPSPSTSKEESKCSTFRSLNHDETQKLKKGSLKIIENLRKIFEKNAASYEIIHENLIKLKQFCDKNRKYLDDLFEKTFLVSLITGRIVKLYGDNTVVDQSKEKLRKSIKLTLISCLADFCYYEKLRNHMKIDENCEAVVKLFSNETDEGIWSKICRLCANFSQDVINIRYFINDDFFESLANCIQNAEAENFELFYNCIRFLRYGCEKSEFKHSVVNNRLLLHISRFMSKNKANKRLHYNNGDFLQQYLLLLDLWQQPYTSTEFCNQIVEGDAIDFLLWLYLDYSDKEEAKSSRKQNSDSKKLPLNFSCNAFSFNLLYKLCQGNDGCRAEIGRVDGIKKLLSLIKSDSVATDDKDKLVELLCYTCKEAVNRHRFKEQNLLCELISLLKKNLYETKRNICSQKLINSICSFAHDQESLNYFLQNSLCDCFIDYLNVQLNLLDETSLPVEEENQFSESYFNKKHNELTTSKCEHNTAECNSNKTFNINEFIKSTIPATAASASAKRKPQSFTFYSSVQMKRTKYSYSPNNIFLPPPPPPLLSPSPSSEHDFFPISPASTFSPSPPNLTSSSPPPVLAYSPTNNTSVYSSTSSPALSLNRSNSLTTTIFDETNDMKIKFSPSIATDNEIDETMTNYSSSSCDKMSSNSNNTFDIIFPPSPASTTTINSIKPSCFTDANNTNIEVINRTEACIFYVFSILSHGDQPSNYILNDKFFTFLLSYLKLTKHTKNPRALRILNRLTKNPQCFQYFIINEFSYQVKFKFNSLFNDDEENGFNSKDIQFYLSSNKVFFDSNIFPKLSSIECLINQNLKQHCLTSSDVCYQNFLNLVKNGTDKEKQACALQMPFILRNCKAMENIMIQLNCLDFLLDSVCKEDVDDEPLFYKSLLCIRKLMRFVNYKYNLKYLKEEYEEYKNKLQSVHENFMQIDKLNEIEFLVDDNKCIKADKLILSRKSDYFNLLLNGSFYEAVSKLKTIALENVEYECLNFIFELLNCKLEDTESSSSTPPSEIKLTFNLCLNLIELTDRFMLFDVKKFLCLFLILNYFSKCTFIDCYSFSLKFNCVYLMNACLDYLLANNLNRDNKTSFVELVFYFKSLARISNKYSQLSTFRLALKNAISEIIKHNCWKY